MKKLPLALIALAAGAGAVYYLDPRHGARRRNDTVQTLADWRDTLQQQAGDRSGDLRERFAQLIDSARLLLDRWNERRARNQELSDDEALEPLSFPPRAVEQATSSRKGMLSALAVAAPVALAVGAVVVKRRHDDGQWLH